MNALFVICAIGFWLLHLVDGWPMIVFASAFFLYLLLRFGRCRKMAACFWLLCCLSCGVLMLYNQKIKTDAFDLYENQNILFEQDVKADLSAESDAASDNESQRIQVDSLENSGRENEGSDIQKRECRVVEIHKNWCLASFNGQSIILYGLETPNFDNIYRIEEIEPVYSLNNIGLFSFQKKMNRQNVFFQAEVTDENLIKKSRGLKALIFEAFRENSLALYLFYGILPDEAGDLVSSLGLPFMGFLVVLEGFLVRFFSRNEARLVCLLAAVVYGILFGWRISLLRLIVFRLCALIKIWPVRWSLQIFMFLLLFGNCAFEFCFVLPSLLSFGMHFQKGLQRKLFSLFLLAGLQIVYFQRLDLLMLFGFSLLRKIWGIYFTAGMVSILIHQEAVLEKLLNFSMSLTVWNGWMSPLFVWIFFILAFWICLFPDWRHKLLMPGFAAFYLAGFFLNPFFHVYMLSIGQGDCTVIVEPFMKSVVMIDAAGTMSGSRAESLIIPFLKSRHLMELDALIITHKDLDHSGSRDDLIKLMPVKNLIEDTEAPIPVDYPFYSLLPKRDTEDENDRSIITLFSYDGFEYLWTGDASSLIEAELIRTYNVKADILKLGHHGSKTSSHKEFLEAVSPKLALISAGYQNRYHHPSWQTLALLRKEGIDSLCTIDEGMIHLASWRSLHFFETASGLCGMIEKEDSKQEEANDFSNFDRVIWKTEKAAELLQ